MGHATLSLSEYENLLSQLPPAVVARLREAWGEPAADPDFHDGAFHFRAQTFGKRFGRAAARSRPLRRTARRLSRSATCRRVTRGRFRAVAATRGKADALVHMGAHGTLEWLPGKAVALTAECFPEIVTGALPVIYPFIVSNPGEAAQAKRRIAGRYHRPPAAATSRRRTFRRCARA